MPLSGGAPAATNRRRIVKLPPTAVGTGGDAFHTPARALYSSLGCTELPVAVFFKQL